MGGHIAHGSGLTSLMKHILETVFLISMLVTSSCARRGILLIEPEERKALEKDLLAFEEFWLSPARIAPPTVSFQSVPLELDGLVAYAQPLLLEDAAWNSWEGPGYRLFNNRLGIAFKVGVTVDDPQTSISWAPQSTFVELNQEDDLNYASASADLLLGPLHSAALRQQEGGMEGDLVDRLRAARQFREAYVPAEADGTWEGVIVFPEFDVAMSDLRIVGDMRLTVAVNVQGMRRILVWTLD
jgi:hypothetical protein